MILKLYVYYSCTFLLTMKNTYFDLFDQSYYLTQDGFDLKGNNFTFLYIFMRYLVEDHSAKFKLLYLSGIVEQIQNVIHLFDRTISKIIFIGEYQYCYYSNCSHSHYSHKTALRKNIQLETSLFFDLELLYQMPYFKKKTPLLQVIKHIPVKKYQGGIIYQKQIFL